MIQIKMPHFEYQIYHLFMGMLYALLHPYNKVCLVIGIYTFHLSMDIMFPHILRLVKLDCIGIYLKLCAHIIT